MFYSFLSFFLYNALCIIVWFLFADVRRMDFETWKFVSASRIYKTENWNTCSSSSFTLRFQILQD